MEILFELLLEFVIQAVGELLLELGLHAMAAPFRRPANPWLAAIGYAIFGAIFGLVSLWPFPRHRALWRWMSLLLVPVAVGLCMSALGSWRAKRGQAVLRIDRFSYGYLFALAFALVRFFFA